MPRGAVASALSGAHTVILQDKLNTNTALTKALSSKHQLYYIPSDSVIYSVKRDPDGQTILVDLEPPIATRRAATPLGPEKTTVTKIPAGETPQAKRKLELDQVANEDGFKTPKAKQGGRGRRSSTGTASPSPRVKSPYEKTRYDTSLGLLTKKFVGLLKSAPDGVVDLNKAAEYLEVQKRRIYDITNVLEGINLIVKKSKNNIQWKGSNTALASSSKASSVSAQQLDLHSDLADLEAKENKLDELLRNCTMQLKHLTEDAENSRLAYVTYQDLRGVSSFDEQTVIAIKAPPDTRLEVPDPTENIQIWLKSTNGPIEVYLCPEETSSNASSSGAPSPSTANTSASASMPELFDDSSTNSDDTVSADSVKGNANRSAFLADQDISPDADHNLLLHTDDQNLESQFEHLEPPLGEDDYMFSMQEGEGISDLFDDMVESFIQSPTLKL